MCLHFTSNLPGGVLDVFPACGCVCSAHLERQQKQEVGVGEPLELLKQVERQEGEGVVLGGLDGVRLEREGE